MQRSSNTRLFPLFIGLIVIALLIAGVVAVGRAVFNGDDSADTGLVADKGQESLLDTGDSRSVSMTVRGPIVANEEFRSYTIIVSPNERTMNAYKGYVEDRTDGNTLSNNTSSYEQFVYALDKANMMKGDVPEDDAENDLRGICATGYVYEYAVLNNNEQVKRLWTSTCGGSEGSLDASKDQVGNLFLSQIPDSDELVPFSRRSVLQF